MSKEKFKAFARIHPELATYVSNGKTSWQNLYELYDIYGENSSVWYKYYKNNENTNSNSETTISDIVNTIKNVDLKSVQKGISNIQKTIGLIENLGILKEDKNISNYEPRPMYKYFED